MASPFSGSIIAERLERSLPVAALAEPAGVLICTAPEQAP